MSRSNAKCGILKIYAQSTGDRCKKLNLGTGKYTIGSDSTAILQLIRADVEPFHCEIEIAEDGLATLFNKVMSKPVPINGRSVAPRMYLLPNDQFSVMGKKFEYVNDKLSPEVIEKARKLNYTALRNWKRKTMGERLSMTPQPLQRAQPKIRRSKSLDKVKSKGKVDRALRLGSVTSSQQSQGFMITSPKSPLKPSSTGGRNAAMLSLSKVNYTEPECDDSPKPSKSNDDDMEANRENSKTPVPLKATSNQDDDAITPVNNKSIILVESAGEDEGAALRSRKSKAKDLSIQRLTQNDDSIVVLDSPHSKTPKSVLKSNIARTPKSIMKKSKLVDEFSELDNSEFVETLNDIINDSAAAEQESVAKAAQSSVEKVAHDSLNLDTSDLSLSLVEQTPNVSDPVSKRQSLRLSQKHVNNEPETSETVESSHVEEPSTYFDDGSIDLSAEIDTRELLDLETPQKAVPSIKVVPPSSSKDAESSRRSMRLLRKPSHQANVDFDESSASTTPNRPDKSMSEAFTPAQSAKKGVLLTVDSDEEFNKHLHLASTPFKTSDKQSTEIESSSQLESSLFTDSDSNVVTGTKRKRGSSSTVEDMSRKRLKKSAVISEELSEIHSFRSQENTIDKEKDLSVLQESEDKLNISTNLQSRIPVRKAITEPKQKKIATSRRSLSATSSNQENEPMGTTNNSTLESVETSSIVYIKNNVTFDNVKFDSPKVTDKINTTNTVASEKGKESPSKKGKAVLNIGRSASPVNVSNVFDVSGIDTLPTDEDDIFPPKKAVRTYDRTPKSNKTALAKRVDEHVAAWVAETTPLTTKMNQNGSNSSEDLVHVPAELEAESVSEETKGSKRKSLRKMLDQNVLDENAQNFEMKQRDDTVNEKIDIDEKKNATRKSVRKSIIAPENTDLSANNTKESKSNDSSIEVESQARRKSLRKSVNESNVPEVEEQSVNDADDVTSENTVEAVVEEDTGKLVDDSLENPPEETQKTDKTRRNKARAFSMMIVNQEDKKTPRNSRKSEGGKPSSTQFTIESAKSDTDGVLVSDSNESASESHESNSSDTSSILDASPAKQPRRKRAQSLLVRSLKQSTERRRFTESLQNALNKSGDKIEVLQESKSEDNENQDDSVFSPEDTHKKVDDQSTNEDTSNTEPSKTAVQIFKRKLGRPRSRSLITSKIQPTSGVMRLSLGAASTRKSLRISMGQAETPSSTTDIDTNDSKRRRSKSISAISTERPKTDADVMDCEKDSSVTSSTTILNVTCARSADECTELSEDLNLELQASSNASEISAEVPVSESKPTKKLQNEGKHDVSDVDAPTNSLQTPKVQNKAVEDLSNISGVASLFSTPKEQSQLNKDKFARASTARKSMKKDIANDETTEMSQAVEESTNQENKGLRRRPRSRASKAHIVENEQQADTENKPKSVRKSGLFSESAKSVSPTRESADESTAMDESLKEHKNDDDMDIKKSSRTPKVSKESEHDLGNLSAVKKLLKTPNEQKDKVTDANKSLVTPHSRKSIRKADDDEIVEILQSVEKSGTENVTRMGSRSQSRASKKHIAENENSANSSNLDLDKSQLEHASELNTEGDTTGGDNEFGEIQKEPESDLGDVMVKKSLRTPKVAKESVNDFGNLSGVKKLLKTPKQQKDGGDKAKRASSTPIVRKSTGKSLTDDDEVTEILQAVDKSANLSATGMGSRSRSRASKKQVDEDEKLASRTPKAPKESAHDLSNLSGVKKLPKTPKEQKDKGDKASKASSTPIVRKSTGKSLTDDDEISEILQAVEKSVNISGARTGGRSRSRASKKQIDAEEKLEPRTPKAPKELGLDLSNLSGVKKTPKEQSSPIKRKSTGKTRTDDDEVSEILQAVEKSANLSETRLGSRSRSRASKKQIVEGEKLADTSVLNSGGETTDDVIDAMNSSRTPKVPKESVDDLGNLSGVKKRPKTPKERKSTGKVLTDDDEISEILQAVDKSATENVTRMGSRSRSRASKKLIENVKLTDSSNPDLDQSQLKHTSDLNSGNEENLSSTLVEESIKPVKSARGRKSGKKDQKEPNNDLLDVEGVKELFQTPKVQKGPANDLSNANISGIDGSESLQPPEESASQKKKRKSRSRTRVSKGQLAETEEVIVDSSEVNSAKSNIKRQSDVLFGNNLEAPATKSRKRSKTVQKEPANDLTDVTGVKKLLQTPRVRKEPTNDLTDVKGVKKLLGTPKVQNEPVNDLTDVTGVKELLAPKKVQNEATNDLTNVAGVKKLMKTPKVPKQPKNDLTQVSGVKELLRTPKEQRPPKNDLSDVEGVAELMRSTEKSAKRGRSKSKSRPSGDGVVKLLEEPSELNKEEQIVAIVSTPANTENVSKPARSAKASSTKRTASARTKSANRKEVEKGTSPDVFDDETPIRRKRGKVDAEEITEMPAPAPVKRVRRIQSKEQINEEAEQQVQSTVSAEIKPTRSTRRRKNTVEETAEETVEEVDNVESLKSTRSTKKDAAVTPVKPATRARRGARTKTPITIIVDTPNTVDITDDSIIENDSEVSKTVKPIAKKATRSRRGKHESEDQQADDLVTPEPKKPAKTTRSKSKSTKAAASESQDTEDSQEIILVEETPKIDESASKKPTRSRRGKRNAAEESAEIAAKTAAAKEDDNEIDLTESTPTIEASNSKKPTRGGRKKPVEVEDSAEVKTTATSRSRSRSAKATSAKAKDSEETAEDLEATPAEAKPKTAKTSRSKSKAKAVNADTETSDTEIVSDEPSTIKPAARKTTRSRRGKQPSETEEDADNTTAEPPTKRPVRSRRGKQVVDEKEEEPSEIVATSKPTRSRAKKAAAPTDADIEEKQSAPASRKRGKAADQKKQSNEETGGEIEEVTMQTKNVKGVSVTKITSKKVVSFAEDTKSNSLAFTPEVRRNKRRLRSEDDLNDIVQEPQVVRKSSRRN